MKYWMFQNNQVKGPYEPDDISQVPGFSAESLVCSEGRKGTNMGDWQRASMVPELSVALLRASQLMLAGKGAVGGGGFYPGLPPEPTLKDLAQLGSLQEKVSLLDGTVTQLQENLRLKETDLLSLHRELEEKNRQAQELAVKLGGMEERLSAFNTLQTSLDKTAAAEHDLEAVIEKQSTTIGELTTHLQSLQTESERLKAESAELKAESAQLKTKEEGEVAELKSALEELKNRPAPAAPSPAPLSPRPEPSGFGAPTPFGGKPVPFGAGEALQPAFGEKLTPLAEPKPEDKPLSGLGSPAPMPAPVAGFSPLGEPPAANPLPFNPLSAAPPSSGGLEVPPPPMSFGGPAAVPAPSPVPAPSMTPEVLTGPPKKSGSGKLVLIAVVLLAVAGGVAVKKGLIPMGKKGGAGADRLPVPPPPEIPKGPTPEELAEQQKKEAIEVVRAFAVPGNSQSLGELLESQNPGAAGLSPWMAEKIKDDMFQVNFYSKSGRSNTTYEFQASLSDKKVLAHNEPAAALLTPQSKKLKKPKIVAKKPARGAKNSDQNILQDLLQVPSDDGEEAAPSAVRAGSEVSGDEEAPKPAPAAKKVKEPKRNVSKELDDLMGEGPAAKPAKAKAAAKKDESLDELLVPGGAKADLEEPEASPDPAAAAPAKAKPSKSKKAAAKPADAELLDDLLAP